MNRNLVFSLTPVRSVICFVPATCRNLDQTNADTALTNVRFDETNTRFVALDRAFQKFPTWRKWRPRVVVGSRYDYPVCGNPIELRRSNHDHERAPRRLSTERQP